MTMSTPRKYPDERWLRRDYRRVNQVLGGKVKGRPLVGRYVAQHLAAGDAVSNPCRMQERTQDTENNHLLKDGLRYVLAASRLLPVPAARKVVMREAKAAPPLFAQVIGIRVSPSDLRVLQPGTLPALRQHAGGHDGPVGGGVDGYRARFVGKHYLVHVAHAHPLPGGSARCHRLGRRTGARAVVHGEGRGAGRRGQAPADVESRSRSRPADRCGKSPPPSSSRCSETLLPSGAW